MIAWQKQGFLFCSPLEGFSQARLPNVWRLHDDIYALVFTSVDASMRSHTFITTMRVDGHRLEILQKPKLVLAPGPLGYFDDRGAMASAFAQGDNGVIYYYYTGWQLLHDVTFEFAIGRAIFDPEKLTITKEFPGPVLAKDTRNLFLNAAAYVLREGKAWRMWYTGGVNWENNNGVLKHYYTIKHANSADGIHWEASPEVCIPFQYDTEYAIARPSVTKIGDTYHMWYTYRETPTIHTYRIGYATSADGLTWTRKDDEAGIDVSPEGWDSEMVGYPHVFEHNGVWFLMYNGNGYGKTGFGYATHDGPIR